MNNHVIMSRPLSLRDGACKSVFQKENNVIRKKHCLSLCLRMSLGSRRKQKNKQNTPGCGGMIGCLFWSGWEMGMTLGWTRPTGLEPGWARDCAGDRGGWRGVGLVGLRAFACFLRSLSISTTSTSVYSGDGVTRAGDATRSCGR